MDKMAALTWKQSWWIGFHFCDLLQLMWLIIIIIIHIIITFMLEEDA